MQLALDKFGRMVLPKSIRDDLGLRPGDRLDAREEGDAIVLRRMHESATVRQEDGVLVFTGTATGDIVGALDRQRRERLEDASGWRTDP